MHVFGRWEEVGVMGGNLDALSEHITSTDKGLEAEPASCEMTVLITTPFITLLFIHKIVNLSWT